MEWKDVTTYKQGEKEKNPLILECKIDDCISVKVHKHIWYGDEWLLSCSFTEQNMVQLDTTNLETAKSTALIYVKSQLANMNSIIAQAIFSIESELM